MGFSTILLILDRWLPVFEINTTGSHIKLGYEILMSPWAMYVSSCCIFIPALSRGSVSSSTASFQPQRPLIFMLRSSVISARSINDKQEISITSALVDQ